MIFWTLNSLDLAKCINLILSIEIFFDKIIITYYLISICYKIRLSLQKSYSIELADKIQNKFQLDPEIQARPWRTSSVFCNHGWS